MAVDAVSLMSTLPHIEVYVIVSGDRDFIHVLKELRRRGKTVIGVSPDKAVSSDFSSLCDRFLRYEALTSKVELEGVESVAEVRAKLAEIVRENPDGLKRFRGQDHAAARAVVELRRERVRVQELWPLPRQDGGCRARGPGTGHRWRSACVSGVARPCGRSQWRSHATASPGEAAQDGVRAGTRGDADRCSGNCSRPCRNGTGRSTSGKCMRQCRSPTTAR